MCAKRSERGLIPGMFNIHTGFIASVSASIGAGSDSFYEYVLKTWMLTNDKELMECFNEVFTISKCFMLHCVPRFNNNS